MFQFFLSTLRSGVRSRGVHTAVAIAVCLMFVALLSGYFSPRQPMTVALDVGFSGVRISLVLLALFWLQETVGREVDRKSILFILAYPAPRSAYVLGRFFGILLLLALAAVIDGLLLWLTVFWAGGHYDQEFSVLLGLPFWLTIFGLWLDVCVVLAFGLLLNCLSTVPILPFMLGLAFAIAGKGLGAALEYVTSGADGDAQLVERFAPLLERIQWFLPDLSRLDWRVWPMYGQRLDGDAMWLGGTMAVAYIGLLLALAVFAFMRRERF